MNLRRKRILKDQIRKNKKGLNLIIKKEKD